MEEISPNVARLAYYAQVPIFYTQQGEKEKIYIQYCNSHIIYSILLLYVAYILYIIYNYNVIYHLYYK